MTLTVLGWALVGLGLAIFVFPPSTATRRAGMTPLWLALPLVGLQIWAGDRSGIEDRPLPAWILVVDGLMVITLGAIGHARYRHQGSGSDSRA